jgi:WD40 repeat protein
MSLFHSPQISLNGLVLCLDAANIKSYSGSGTSWTDLTGKGNNATLTNGPTYSSANCGSIVFDGVNDYVNTVTATSLGINSASTPFTIGAWFKTTGTSEYYLFDNYNGSNDISLRIDGGKLEVYLQPTVSGIINAVQFGSGYNNNAWHNFTITWNGSNVLTAYADGVNIGINTTTLSGSFETNAAFQIGNRPVPGAGVFSGNIAQVSVYNRALTSSEIQQNYNALRGRFIDVASSQTSDFTGFGVKYADPVTIPTGYGYSIDFSPSGDAIIIGHQNSPYVTAYPFDLITGIGTKYTNPTSSLSATAFSPKFSPSGNYVVLSSGNDLITYGWNSSTGFGAKLSTTLSSSFARYVRFNPTETSVVYSKDIDGGGSLGGYVWNSATGFGAQLTSPSPSSHTYGRGLSFNKAGNVIAHTGALTSTGILAYAWNNSSGFGTRFSSPVASINSGYNVTFSPSDDVIAIGSPTSPSIFCVAWNNSTGFGSKYADPAVLPPGSVNSVAFSPTGNAIILGTGLGVTGYPWNSSTGFGSKYTIPTLISGVDCADVAFHPSGKAIAVLTGFTSPYFAVYAC